MVNPTIDALRALSTGDLRRHLDHERAAYSFGYAGPPRYVAKFCREARTYMAKLERVLSERKGGTV